MPLLLCYCDVCTVHETCLSVDISMIEVAGLKQCFLTFGSIFIFQKQITHGSKVGYARVTDSLPGNGGTRFRCLD
jgi:hypothetical protein